MLRSIALGCFLLLISSVFCQETSIVCPFPDGTYVITEQRCNVYSACVWSSATCHMGPDIETSYVMDSIIVPPSKNSMVFLTKADLTKTMFGGDYEKLSVEIIHHEEYHFQIKISDAGRTRYEVPIDINLPDTSATKRLYEISMGNNVDHLFDLQVTRKENNAIILKTIGPLTYEDQFMQITFSLASSYLYGLGENSHLRLKHIFNPRTTFPLMARPQGYTEEPVNLMGQHPLFMVMEDDMGRSHSVFFLSSSPMESSTFLLDDGTPALTIRAIGGIFDMHFFMGPYPEDLNKQYANLIGFPALPPYWYIGFQLSRYGYNGTDHVREVVKRNQEAEIPQDIQTCDINYMDNYRIFTIGKGSDWNDLPQLAQELHLDNLYLTLILDPPLAIDWDKYPPSLRGKEQDVYTKWESPFLIPSDQDPSCNDYVVGYMWPNNKTVFPDFLLQRARDWWAEEINTFYDTVQFDSLWIDMNEPVNFGTDMERPSNYPSTEPDWSLKCPGNKFEDPPYPTMTVRITENQSGRISDGTVCMSAGSVDGNYSHYDVHSLYGLYMSQATYQGLELVFPEKRPSILSRSTYPGYGKFGSHWLGDNHSTWNHMRLSIIGILEFNMFAIPMVGADICGHFDEPSAELCTRWMQLGSFYTFCRNHNSMHPRDQDPAYWGDPTTTMMREALVIRYTYLPYLYILLYKDPAYWGGPTTSIMKDVLLIRYTYLPYLYTLLYKASLEGSSVLRPLWNVFPNDIESRDVEDQFFWGTGLMIAPVLAEFAVERTVHFPPGDWYDLLSGKLIATGPSQTKMISAPLEVIPLYVFGGNILPSQEPAIRTDMSRLNPMGLLVALNQSSSASGELYWDDGENIDSLDGDAIFASINFQNDELTYSLTYGSTSNWTLIFSQVDIYGYTTIPSDVLLNDLPLDSISWAYDSSMSTLHIEIVQPINENFTLSIQQN